MTYSLQYLAFLSTFLLEAFPRTDGTVLGLSMAGSTASRCAPALATLEKAAGPV